MHKHKTLGCTKLDCCHYDNDPATCDDVDCPCPDIKNIDKKKSNNIFSKIFSKNNTPSHCGLPPKNEMGCGCVIALFTFWLLIPIILFVSKFNKKKTIVKANSFINDKPKIAFISVYNTKCGIATYNAQLIKELNKYVDIRVFAEYADDSHSENIIGDEPFVIRCWDRDEHPKLKLIKLVDDWKPDLIHFGHEYGFFAKAHFFTSLVSWFKSRNYPVVATMHSIYEHRDKTVQEANGQIIIAHTTNGKKCLTDKGIDESQICVIPHGSNIFKGTHEAPELIEPLWNTWYNDHVIFQPGFLFDYKGHLRMLRIIAKLKEKYPDIHYIIQGSENPKNMQEHERLFMKLVNKCAELNIEENVTINRGFVSENVLMSFLRTCKVCVLPYASHPEHDVYSTSGIARIVCGTQIPLVTSTVHLFDDVKLVSFQASTDEEMFNTIDKIFSKPNVQEEYNHARVQFLKETSWASVSKQHIDLYLKVIKTKLVK